MSASLKFLISVTDVLFIFYWFVAALSELGLLSVPPEMMYADYDDPRVVAWNWSFFPLDIVFSIVGLAAIQANRSGHGIWRPLAIISLTLTMTAGGMAVSYWAILREFDASWFIPNLVLLIWPMFFLPGLVRGRQFFETGPGENGTM